jgi:plasmid stabilization system protein ParE
MPHVRVAWSGQARAQLAAASQWWCENRAGTDLLSRDVDAGVELLAAHPLAGPSVPLLPGVRRLLLRRTQHLIYYRVEHEQVWIVAFWHTARGSGPPL